MTASKPSTSVEDHKSEVSALAMVSSNFTKRLDGLPSKVQAKIFAYMIPQAVDLDFLGCNPAKWPKKPSTTFMLTSLPGVIDKINTQILNQTCFNFKSSTPRKAPVIHGCDVALALLNHIKPAHVGHIRTITCDLDWHNKESASMLLQMLAKLATQPSRAINDIRFEFEAAPGVRRSKKGVVSKTFGFTLKGLIGLKITIFVVGLNRLPDADEFAVRMNQWFQRHHKLTSTPVNFLNRLPLEVKLMIYRNLPLAKWEVNHNPMHTVARKAIQGIKGFDSYDSNTVLPSSSLPLLMVNYQMSEEILPVLYGCSSLELETSSRWRHERNATRNGNDKATWITRRLHGLGSKAKFIKKVTIVIEMYSPRSRSYSREYTPSLKAVLDKVEECCDFQLADGYRTLPNDEIPIVSVLWKAEIRRRCFLIRLPTRRNTELMVEVQTDFGYEAPGSLAYDSQCQVVREGFKHSVNGMRFKLDDFGSMIPA